MARLSEYFQGHLWPSPWGNVKCMKTRHQQLLKHKSEILGNKIMQRLWNVSIFTNRSPAAWIFAKQSTTALASLIFNQGRDENPCWTQAWVAWSCFNFFVKMARTHQRSKILNDKNGLPAREETRMEASWDWDWIWGCLYIKSISFSLRISPGQSPFPHRILWCCVLIKEALAKSRNHRAVISGSVQISSMDWIWLIFLSSLLAFLSSWLSCKLME